MKRPFKNKKSFKLSQKKCYICEENKFELLDTHRIIPQKKYSYNNCICLCNRCHRLHHTGIIRIIGWKESSIGKILHYFDENKI